MNGTAPAPSGALSQRHGPLLSKTLTMFQTGVEPGSPEAKSLREEWASARSDEGDRQRLALAVMSSVVCSRKFGSELLALVYGPGHKNFRLATDLLAVQEASGVKLASFTGVAVADLLDHLGVDFSDGPAPSLDSDDPDALAASMLAGVEPTRARVGYTAHQWMTKSGLFAPYVERGGDAGLDLFGDDDPPGAVAGIDEQIAQVNSEMQAAAQAMDFAKAGELKLKLDGLNAQKANATTIPANGHQPVTATTPPAPPPDLRAGLLTRIAEAVTGKSLRPKAAETLRQRLGAGEDPTAVEGVLASLLKK